MFISCHERVKLSYSKGLMQSSDDVDSNGAWAVGGRGGGGRGNLGGGGGWGSGRETAHKQARSSSLPFLASTETLTPKLCINKHGLDTYTYT